MQRSFSRLAVCGVVSLTGVAILIPNLLRLVSLEESALGVGLAGLGTALALVLVGAGIFLYRSDVTTPHAARVAGWNVLGVVVLGAVLYLVALYQDLSAPTFLVANVLAVSAFAHVLIGFNDVRRIRAEELATEREKLAVSNRLVRHNLRHEAQLLHGVAAQLQSQAAEEDGSDASDGPAPASETVDAVAAEIGEMHDAVQSIQRFVEREPAMEPRRLTDVLEAATAEVRERFPDATFEVDVGDHAVRAGEELDGAIAELLENAIEHGEPPVRVTAERDGREVVLSIADDGDGIPEDERRVVLGETEPDQLEHGSGMGLWLARWTVEYYDGTFDIEAPADGGTRAICRLRAA